VENAKVGLTHATGGGVAGYDHGACSIHVFTT
ncbi:MAG: Acetyl-CoA acetyltransferase, partial [Hyphomicrobiales bacterium]|nr:Acetyl-CoA acetyltransferase [Hyphomicrobiales bacterium]